MWSFLCLLLFYVCRFRSEIRNVFCCNDILLNTFNFTVCMISLFWHSTTYNSLNVYVWSLWRLLCNSVHLVIPCTKQMSVFIIYVFWLFLSVTCDDPLYVMSHSKTVLSQAISSDTQFLASQSVMDYSLLVGLDKERRELVVGIIGMYCIHCGIGLKVLSFMVVCNQSIMNSCTSYSNTGLFKMIVGVLTSCHTQYTWDRNIHQGSGLCSSFSRKYPGTEGTNQNRHWNHHRWHATYSLERTRLSCWCLWNHKWCTSRAPVRYVTKTWSVVLLNKKIHIFMSQVYCVRQVVKTPRIISNNPVESQRVHIKSTCKACNINLECCSIK